MHTVIETEANLRTAKRIGMTALERRAAIDVVALDPRAGVLIVGSGGCRKLRLAREGGGKSGGYRIVTYFGGEDLPVALLAVLSKTSESNFSDEQIRMLAAVAAGFERSLGSKMKG